MKRGIPLLLAAACLAGCSEKQLVLACTVQEQPGRTLTLRATLSNPRPEDNGVRQLEGQTEYNDGGRVVQVPTSGSYLARADGRDFELLTFGDLPNGLGKLNIAVQPSHPVLRRRGTRAVVLTGEQTVETATLARAICRTAGAS